MNHLVALGVGSYDVGTLCALFLDRLLGVLDIVLLLLGNIFGLLAALALMEHGEACLKSLEFAIDWTELAATLLLLAIEHALDEGMVAVENEVEASGIWA